jgi:hypothetical protein
MKGISIEPSPFLIVTLQGEARRLNDYQEEALLDLLAYEFGLVFSATWSSKLEMTFNREDTEQLRVDIEAALVHIRETVPARYPK